MINFEDYVTFYVYAYQHRNFLLIMKLCHCSPANPQPLSSEYAEEFVDYQIDYLRLTTGT